MPKEPKLRKQKRRSSKSNRDYEDLTWIGTISNAHGIQGELRIYPLTDTPEYYLDTKQFFIEKGEQLLPVVVQKLRFHKNQWVAKFESIDDRDQAESYIQYRVLIEDSLLRPLDENEYFLHELIGCQIEDLNGNNLGEVIDVMQTGANDVYTVASGNQNFLVPAIPQIVKEVDLPQKKIRIDPIPGLMEE
ncbi:MAG: 16S rRNA processing protein RimM [SAR324 cluster bacterium]|nr:16S rRNA processing protein RimM [SAR324 cluster bacterium]